MTPIGPRPISSPTSLPDFASECTQHPTSSSSGWSRTPSIAARPTPPVAHWITRNGQNAIGRCFGPEMNVDGSHSVSPTGRTPSSRVSSSRNSEWISIRAMWAPRQK